MSLIHDALREMDKGTGTAAGAADFRALAPSSPTRSRWVPFAVGLVAVLAVAAAGGWVWHSTRAAAPLAAMVTPQAQAAAQVPAAVPPAAPAAPAELAPTPSASAPMTVAAASVSAAPAGTSMPGAVAPSTGSSVGVSSGASDASTHVGAGKVTSTPRASAVPRTAAAPKPARASRPEAVTSAPVAPAMPVEQRYALFLASMKAGDLAAAREQLSGLQSQIPPGTMTRLRAEAWFALQSGDEPTARRSYQDMLERLPGDEEAAINLASMEARAGQREKARQVLSDALAYNPGSETLLAALARFKAPARN
ncbi:hypothetical protein ACDW_01800 [Acidovorax sp. DW039]|uniref:tetratricopeptide repeat protein n=1 Tax=Acidovorax sp. DW039 TaxID=3095606 RepID=UPI00308A638F|nr:hypothetical protein ACDW_01800 [Acidovorax sp. DW039]